MRICAVTVLYNPGSYVPEHIETYLHQVEKVFIIDNSAPHDPAMARAIRERFPPACFTLVSNDRNAGIGGALNQAFQLAAAQGFDWVLTMDQDSYFADGKFFSLAMPLLEKEGIGIVAASYRQKNPFRKPYSVDFSQYLFVITSANLLSVPAWESIGGFNEQLFIDEVDNDFCVRLSIKGWQILSSEAILLQHRLGEPFALRLPFSGKNLQLGIHSPLRARYTVRNRLFVMKAYCLRYPGFVVNRLYHTLMLLGFIIFLYPKKLQYLSAFFKGVGDFLFSRYGKIENTAAK